MIASERLARILHPPAFVVLNFFAAGSKLAIFGFPVSSLKQKKHFHLPPRMI
jgi:hypothetical protein